MYLHQVNALVCGKNLAILEIKKKRIWNGNILDSLLCCRFWESFSSVIMLLLGKDSRMKHKGI